VNSAIRIGVPLNVYAISVPSSLRTQHCSFDMSQDCTERIVQNNPTK